MDFTIGRIPPPAGAPDRKAAGAGQIEAKVLHVRAPRRHPEGDQAEARQTGSTSKDPAGARVLVLLVPDGHRLPEDLTDVDYRIFLRIARK